MRVHDILGLKSMRTAKLVAGKQGVSNEIRGVNVLEATDISNWGKSGEVILTSFFALQNLDNKELAVFFEKLSNVNISAFIIKIDRLLTCIPVTIMELCDQYAIPLIQIGGDVKYETIILDILGPIVNRNISLLDRYYEIHSDLTKMALKRPSISEILREFKKMIQRDVSLVNITKNKSTATNEHLSSVELIECKEVATEKYMHFKYERHEVLYNDLPDRPKGKQIHVAVPYLGYDEYELVIHELDQSLTPEDFMVLENAVKFLQMELLKKFVISQNIAQQKNNIIGDLLNDRLYEEKDVDEVLESLEIHKYRYYQIILIKLTQKDEDKELDPIYVSNILRKIKIKIRTNFPNVVFMEKTDRVVFMQNFHDLNYGIKSATIEKIVQELVEDNVFEEFYYTISISSKVDKLGIPKANREALDTQNILRLFHSVNKILDYEELGIYKLFIDTGNLEDLRKFLSPKIVEFRENNSLLFETLGTFLDTNQNYNVTSERLFLHPKTVRYRIDKIKSMLDIDFNNPEDILQIQIASRLFKLMSGRKANE